MNNYNSDKWINRYQHRSDIGVYLTHLTKSTNTMSAVEVLIKILNERKLLGSTNSGFIPGSDKAVCFQDTPLYGIAQNLLHEENYRGELGNKVRYEGVGLLFPKPYIFNRGGRPVIYETKETANMIFANNKWRTVSMNYNDPDRIIDWSHEREWRIKGDFDFDISRVFILVSNSKEYKYLIQNTDKAILSEVEGIINLVPIYI